MTLRSGTGQACAACKFQRRRCTSQCLLAPFFPADQPEVFQSVHRLFGVKHIQKLLKELPPDKRPMAMKSVKFHAKMHDKNPVGGCWFEIQILGYQIQVAEEELHAVLQQLHYYRQLPSIAEDDYLSQLQLGMAPPGNTTSTTTTHASSCSNNVDGDYYNKPCNNDIIDSLWIPNSMVMQSQPMAPLLQDQDYIHSFFDNIDDRQSYIGPKDVYESSLESTDRDSDGQMAENELKNAAACFSLTSFN